VTDRAGFVVGANLPWLRYGGDFGANAWSPQGGLASRGRDGGLDERLHLLRARGVEDGELLQGLDAAVAIRPRGTASGD